MDVPEPPGGDLPRVRLVHWNGPDGRERRLQLASLGYHAEFDDVDAPALLPALRATPPAAFVIDLSRLPSHGRDVAMWLRTRKATRAVPIVFVGGEAAKVRAIKALLPDATYTTWGRIKTALPRAIARRHAAPVVPPSPLFSNKPVVDKLGVKAGMTVCLQQAPEGFAAALKPPPGVRFTARPAPAVDLFLAFLRSRGELAVRLDQLARCVTRQTVWLAWPKKASRVRTDLSSTAVRDAALASGWVDFKVCAIDDTWSALAFKRR